MDTVLLKSRGHRLLLLLYMVDVSAGIACRNSKYRACHKHPCMHTLLNCLPPHPRKLAVIEVGVEAVHGEEFLVGACLDNAAVIHNKY